MDLPKQQISMSDTESDNIWNSDLSQQISDNFKGISSSSFQSLQWATTSGGISYTMNELKACFAFCMQIIAIWCTCMIFCLYG